MNRLLASTTLFVCFFALVGPTNDLYSQTRSAYYVPAVRAQRFSAPNYAATSYRATPNFSVPSHRPTAVHKSSQRTKASFYGNRYPAYQSYVYRRTAPRKVYPSYARKTVVYSIQPRQRGGCST